MLHQRLTHFWAAHAASSCPALLQAFPRECRRRPISYFELHDWIQELNQVLSCQDDVTAERLVVAINVAPFSVEETALLLLVAEQEHWVYVPVDVHLPLARQLSLLQTAGVQRLVTLPGSLLDKFLAGNGRKGRDIAVQSVNNGEIKSWTVDSSPFLPVRVFEIPTNHFQSDGSKSGMLRKHGDTNEDGNAAPLYILFTSGATGTPRGVLGTRTGAWTRLEWMWKTYPFHRKQSGTEERVMRATKLSFVDCVWEVLGAFLEHVPLVHLQRPRGEDCRHQYLKSVVLDDSEQFLEVMRSEQVARITVIPSVLEVMILQTRLADRQSAFQFLRYLLSSGETLRLYIVQQLLDELPDVTILNLYGSTEVSGDITCMPLKAPLLPEKVAVWERYGLPIAELRGGGIVGDNSRLVLLPDHDAKGKRHLDAQGSLSVTVWPKKILAKTSAESPNQSSNGVLYVSGPLVACGYVGPHEQDGFASCSTMDGTERVPTSDEDYRRWFCMGDLCTVVGDYLFYCGRTELVVKINGIRVSLEEIERAVLAAVKEAKKSSICAGSAPAPGQCGQQVVAFSTTKQTNKYRLQQRCAVVCIIRETKENLSVTRYTQTRTLNAWISEHYGSSRIPHDVLVVNPSVIRRLTHGKIDRQALEELYYRHLNARSDTTNSPATEPPKDNDLLEKVVGGLLADVLGISSAGTCFNEVQTCTFVELGGNSLLATLFLHELRQKLGSVSLTVQDLLGSKSVGDLLTMLGSPPKQQRSRSPRPDTGNVPKRQKSVSSGQVTSSGSTTTGNSQLKELEFLSRYNQSSMAVKGVYLPSCYPVPVPAQPTVSPSHLEWKLINAWRVNLGKCIDASPLVVQRRDTSGSVISNWAIVGSHSAQIICVDVENGREIWRVMLADRIEASAALSTRKDIVYVGTYAGTLFALDLESGNTRWTFHAKRTIKATAVVVDSYQLVICGAYDSKLYGLDTVTGKTRWAVDLHGSVFSMPFYCDWSGQLFVASTSGDVVALDLSSSSGSDPSEMWQLQLPAPVFAGLNVDYSSKLLLVGCADGQMYGVKSESGAIVWTLRTDKPIFSSPCIYRPGSAVFGSHDGMLRRVNCHNGELVWTADLHGAVFASPTVVLMSPPKQDSSESSLACCVTTTTGELFFCDETTGSIIYRTSESTGKANDDSSNGERSGDLGPIFGSPVLIGNWCLLGTRTNYFYGFKLAY